MPTFASSKIITYNNMEQKTNDEFMRNILEEEAWTVVSD